ncbi:leucine-rich repeat protein [Ruminococcus sp. OA3]|uniref:leucine-rich repeat protein n=1 Tax=Ruminococcus sp. OA3 TaxID=2914164 RepID=UPI001F06764F|nr:leucine-rich repeat protein [Ruminococcus sp. OA3]MCH1981883.1 leucine-rich repeat protein [Ruminococcus sp. OA3]
MKKKISALFLAVTLTILPPVPYAICADAETDTGTVHGGRDQTVGETEDTAENSDEGKGSVTEWRLSDSVTAYCKDGVLTLSGHGAAVPDGEWSGWEGAIRAVAVEEGITELASYLFAGMPDLEEVTLPETLESIGSYVFEGCQKLQRVELPEAIHEIPEGAFQECTSLETMDLRGNVDFIGSRAFYGCKTLKNTVDFENAVVVEKNMDFIRVKDREAVVGDIPFNRVTIGDGAFYGCENLKAVLFTENSGLNKKAFDLKAYGEKGLLTVYCYDENKMAANEMFSGKGIQIVVIQTDVKTEKSEVTEKAIFDEVADPYFVLTGLAARAAADNTIAYPTMTPAAYAKTDSRFTVIRPDKFTLNGEYEFCARVLYSGKAYEKQNYITKVTAFGPWDNKEMGDWAKRIAVGDSQLQNSYKSSGILHTARITDDSGKGKFGAWYRNVGTYKGKIIDAKAVISNYTLYKEGARQGLGILGLSEDRIGIFAKNISNVTLRIEFYEHGSSTKKVNVKGFALLDDVDYGQGVKVESAYDNIYVLDESTFAVYKNHVMTSPVLIDKSGANNTDYYPFALQVEFDSNVFEYKYHNDRYFYRDGLANAYIDPAAYTKAGSWNAYWKSREPYFVDNLNPGYQGFSARRMAKTSLPVPAMTVTDKDEKAVQENTLDSPGEEYFYTISQNIPREEAAYYYSDFTVKDLLPKCLEFVSAKVEDDTGKDVTFRFLVSHNNQNVIFQVKTPDSAIFYGVTYHFKVQVRIRRPLNYAVWLNTETGYYEVENQSVSTLIRGGGSSSKKSNTVKTRFREEVLINYHSNFRKKEQEQFTEKTYRNFPYIVRKNDENIHFKEGGTAVFAGWDQIPEAFAENVRFPNTKLPMKVEDVTKALGQPDLYAIWDYAPDIRREEVPVYYEGELITKEMLMKEVVVQDLEDNRQGIELPLDIRKIRSDDETLSREYPEGMQSEDDFQVSFGELGKTEEDGDQILWVTYHTTDSAGNETNKELKIQIRYNHPPVIEATDRTYLLEEVRDGMLTEELVLNFASATDVEDDEARDLGLMAGGKLVDINDNLSIVGFDSEVFKTPGEILVTYHVADRFGKETFHSIIISVIDGGIESLPDTEGEVRFISEKYYRMGQEEGGLHEDSRWYTQRDYVDQITEVFSNTKSDEGEWKILQGKWCFSTGEIARAKQYIRKKGIGNSQTADGLEEFLKEFPREG